jgi:undecaprenyl diphosphate synthase
MWPAFTPEDLAAAIDDFARRERRFGGVAALGTPALLTGATQ